MQDRSVDESFMRIALQEANKAFDEGEIPVGAVLVLNDTVIASAHNTKERNGDPTAHAEINVIRAASLKLSKEEFARCTLYVTLEPCVMCAGAVLQARFERIVFGTLDPRAGACWSLYRIPEDKRLPWRCKIQGGVLAVECKKILDDFFRLLRGGWRGGRAVEGGRLEID